MKPLVVLSTIIYDGYELDEMLEHISRATKGCYVEISCVEGITEHIKPEQFGDTAFENQLQKRLKELNLKTISFGGNMDLTNQEAIPYFVKKMEFCNRMGIKNIHAFFGPLNKLDDFYRNMEKIDKIAHSLGIVVGVENHEGIMSKEPNITAIKKVRTENIGLTYDFVNAYHAAGGNIDLLEDLEEILPYVVHFHLKDTLKIEDVWEFVEVGTGIMDYLRIFKFLKKNNITLPLTIELPVRLELNDSPPRKAKKVRPPMDINRIDSIMSNSLFYVEQQWELA